MEDKGLIMFIGKTRASLAAFFLSICFIAAAQTTFAGDRRPDQLFPANNATKVNPDVQLKLIFSEPPVLGTRGKIRVYDGSNGSLVDQLDLSVPPGPTERASGAARSAPYLSHPYPTDDLPEDQRIYLATPYPYNELPKGRTNKNTKAGTPTAGAIPPSNDYQLTIIGGFSDGFHFYPVIVDGNTVIIQLHHNLLDYGKSYYVEVDPEVLRFEAGNFAGIQGKSTWRFSTKLAKDAPKQNADELTVRANGTGDFNTVQGALDYVPDDKQKRVTIKVSEGTYHEIVYFRQKHNITIRGEAPGKVRITYANNETFNPHPVNYRTNERPGTFPSRRATFTVDNADDVRLENLILENTASGQAEGLLITGKRNILDHVDVIGAGDALQVNGPTYIVDSTVTGTGDTILSRGPAFFERCTINSTRVFMWVRNTEHNHGLVFNNCRFNGTGPEPTTLARSPKNNVSIYPHAEVVILNSVLTGISEEGWGAADLGGKVRFWEFNSRKPDSTVVDTSKRVPWSRQLDAQKDAEVIRSYSNPAFILNGWEPTQ